MYFGRRTKVSKRNTASLRLQGYTLKRENKILHPLAWKQKFYFLFYSFFLFFLRKVSSSKIFMISIKSTYITTSRLYCKHNTVTITKPCLQSNFEQLYWATISNFITVKWRTCKHKLRTRTELWPGCQGRVRGSEPGSGAGKYNYS